MVGYSRSGQSRDVGMGGHRARDRGCGALGCLHLFQPVEKRRWRRLDQGRSQLRQRRSAGYYDRIIDYDGRRIIAGELSAKTRLAMRPIAVLVIATQICLFAPTTWAETQVKA